MSLAARGAGEGGDLTPRDPAGSLRAAPRGNDRATGAASDAFSPSLSGWSSSDSDGGSPPPSAAGEPRPTDDGVAAYDWDWEGTAPPHSSHLPEPGGFGAAAAIDPRHDRHRRNGQDQDAASIAKREQQQQQQQGHDAWQLPDPTEAAAASTLRAWLTGLGMERFFEEFWRQEVDLSVVHMLTVEDLIELGVGDSRDRRRFMDAARKARCGGETSGRPPRPRHQQQQQQQLLWRPTATALPKMKPTPGPPWTAIAAPRPGATPGLRPSSAAPALRVSLDRSLWTCAAECREIADNVDARLLRKRRAPDEANAEGDTSGDGRSAAATPNPSVHVPVPLIGRGGTAYPRADESRALKLVKLEALRQELVTHQRTVADLMCMVAELEAELGLAK
jgi:hypothetical protein